MPRGLPRSYITKAKSELGAGASFSAIFKRAWQLYKGGKVYQALHKDSYRKSYKGRSPRTSRRKPMVRRYTRKRRRRRTRTIPLLPIAGVVASSNAWGAWGDIMNGDVTSFLEKWIAGTTGYSFTAQNFDIARLQHGLVPILAGVLGHKALSFLGVNRYFRNLPSPLNKVRL